MTIIRACALAQALLMICPMAQMVAEAAPAGFEGPVVLKRRQAAAIRYNRYEELLNTSSSTTIKFTFINPTSQEIELPATGFFYDLDRIKKEIQIEDYESDQIKAIKIYKFVKKKWKHSIPLFESKLLHETPYYLSVYGSGFCDDAASNMVYLCKIHGLRARSLWLNGHVIAEVYYDDGWHAYDPDVLGYFEEESRIISFDEWVLRARRGFFKQFNEIIANTEDDKIRIDDIFHPKPMGDVDVRFRAGEKRRYYDRLWALVMDGNQLKADSDNAPIDRQQLLQMYPDLANFTREVPIKNLVKKEGFVELDAYFPFVGVFILARSEALRQASQFPLIKVDYDFATEPVWINFIEHPSSGPSEVRLDGSLALRNMSLQPTHKIFIGRLKYLLEADPDARLLTVHLYNRRNIDISTHAIDSWIAAGGQFSQNPEAEVRPSARARL